MACLSSGSHSSDQSFLLFFNSKTQYPCNGKRFYGHISQSAVTRFFDLSPIGDELVNLFQFADKKGPFSLSHHNGRWMPCLIESGLLGAKPKPRLSGQFREAWTRGRRPRPRRRQFPSRTPPPPPPTSRSSPPAVLQRRHRLPELSTCIVVVESERRLIRRRFVIDNIGSN